MQNRRQHYIPQFYLNKFVDPLVLPPMTPYVWVFEKNAYESIKKAPINTAYGLGFYDFHYKDGTMSTNFDDNLKILESKAAVISKKIEKGFIINNNDKMVFAEFIWTMQMRTPYQRNNINNTLTEIERYMLKVTANHPDELRKMISGRNNNVEIADAEIEKLIDIIKSDNFDVIIPPEYSISNIIELAEEFTKIIFDMNWCFLLAPDDLCFITSDNPVILKDPMNKSLFYGDGYLSSKSIELTFPISPSICLLASRSPIKMDFIKVDRYQIFNINNRICNHFQKYIFSTKKMVLSQIDMNLYFIDQ